MKTENSDSGPVGNPYNQAQPIVYGQVTNAFPAYGQPPPSYAQPNPYSQPQGTFAQPVQPQVIYATNTQDTQIRAPPVGSWSTGLCDCFNNIWPSCGCVFIFHSMWIQAQSKFMNCKNIRCEFLSFFSFMFSRSKNWLYDLQ